MPDYSAGEAKLAIVPDISGFARKLEADLKKIDAHLPITVTADVAQARTDIDRFRDLQRRKGIQIGVETSLVEADAKMAAWRARQQANDVKIRVNADTSSALDKIKGLDKAFESILGTLGSGLRLNLTLAGIGEIPAATLVVAQLAGAIEQLSGAGLALPGVFAGIGASVGTLALGLSGIKDAYDAVSKAAKPTLTEQAQHTREVTAATNANRNAVADMAQAERDRTRAVKDAKFALEDLNLQLRGGKISEQQAINTALRQRRDLQRDMATGQIKDQLDLQQRLLDIQEADQGVAEAHQRNIELQDKWGDAQQKGIANSDAVVQANERVTRSQQTVAQSADALKDAIAKPMAAVNDAMANLSPNAQKVITTLQGAQQQFLAFGNDIQDKVTDGIGNSIKTLIDADLPHLQTGMGSIATAWNGTLKQLFSSLGSDSSKGLLDRILGNTAKAQDEFNKAIEPIINGVGTLTAAGTDVLPRLADAIGSVATRFDNFITAADKDGSLSKWINDGLTGFGKLGDTMLNIGSSIHSVTKAAGGGDGLLSVLSKGSQQLAAFLKSTEGQNKLKEWFAEGSRELHDHIIPLLQSLPGFFKGVIDAGTQIANIVVPPLKDISHFLGEHPGLIKGVVEAFVAWKGIAGVASLIDDLGKIDKLLGGKGGKGGKGGSGLLGKIGLFAAALSALHIIDDITDDGGGDAKPPTAGDTATNVGTNAGAGAWAGAKIAGIPGALVGAGAGAVKGLYDSASQDVNAAKQRDANDAKKPGPNQNYVQHPLLYNPDGSLKPAAGDELRAKIAAGQVHGYSLAPDGTIIGPDGKPVNFGAAPQGPRPIGPVAVPTNPLAPDDLGGLLHYFTGGGTPTSPGPLPDGGYHAIIHPKEFVANPTGRSVLGDSFLNAANHGIVDPKLLPHFDVGGPGDGTMVDGYGNPVTPGMLPGPSTPPDVAPIAPNPMGSTGVMSAVGSFVSGLGSPIQNITNVITGGKTGGGQNGAGSYVPGLWGLPGAMKVDADTGTNLGTQGWAQQTGNYLANWAGGTLAKLGGSLYKGVLDFFGLGNSILSPSNAWFQAGAQSLGVFDKLAPLFGWGADGSGNLTIGSETTAVGPNGQESITTPTFGTSSTPNSGVGGTGSAALNALSKASTLGGASVSYTPDFLLSHGIAPLYTRVTDDKGQSQPQIPQWANQLAAAFNLTATSHPDDTLHGGQSGRGDSINTNAAWAFDFSGKPDDEQRFADFLSSSLRPQVLQAIWQNPNSGQQLGIAGGQLLGQGQYYTTAGGSYADHTNHVHWATDVPPNLWDANGNPLIPGIPPRAGASPSATPGQLPVALPAGISGGGRGAGLNLALAAAGKGGDPASNKVLAQQIFGQYFPVSEWGAFDTLEMHEAGYNNTAKNPSSTAYGMGQFLDSTWAAYGPRTSDPATQIRYMLQYIKNRYGTPSAAWAQYYNHPGGVGWYSLGGGVPGRGSGDTVPAMLTPGEHVLTTADVAAMGGQQGVLDFRAGLHGAQHFDLGGIVQPLLGVVSPPPKPTNPQLPDVQHIQPPRGSTVIPSAPTTQLPTTITAPAPSAPTPPPVTQQQQQQDPNQQQRPFIPGPANVAPAPTQLNHNLDALNTGITSGFATAGSLASSAISAAAAAGTFGAGAAGASGSIGSLVQGLFTEGGKIATNVANIGSSFLVGNVPGSGSTTDRAYGDTQHPQQRVPVTAPSSNGDTYNFNGMDVNRVFQELDIRRAQASQAQLAKYGG
ncbi:hypothetical protein OS122_02500 [Mycolicibacterium mucogenicum]|uniref:aggregation-promoting factor C-terminal-like domain-containing protein n=1 Tax=Mycolicibacterium mucogenicum TaxID=56689 RepID=UPI00226AE7CA|nr:hypothetical protein [Mycolicibacterium mucogenicum]MCX8559769.1 hypothetical protein [Mycolicibacterium mucogenicum]